MKGTSALGKEDALIEHFWYATWSLLCSNVTKCGFFWIASHVQVNVAFSFPNLLFFCRQCTFMLFDMVNKVSCFFVNVWFTVAICLSSSLTSKIYCILLISAECTEYWKWNRSDFLGLLKLLTKAIGKFLPMDKVCQCGEQCPATSLPPANLHPSISIWAGLLASRKQTKITKNKENIIFH